MTVMVVALPTGELSIARASSQGLNPRTFGNPRLGFNAGKNGIAIATNTRVEIDVANAG